MQLPRRFRNKIEQGFEAEEHSRGCLDKCRPNFKNFMTSQYLGLGQQSLIWTLGGVSRKLKRVNNNNNNNNLI